MWPVILNLLWNLVKEKPNKEQMSYMQRSLWHFHSVYCTDMCPTMHSFFKPSHSLLCSYYQTLTHSFSLPHIGYSQLRKELKCKGKAIPVQPLRVPVGWGCQISKQLAHEGGKSVSCMHCLRLPPRKYSCYSFLLGAESTPRPKCS
jgi:hypothetical protein